MADYEKAMKSAAAIEQARGDISILTADERANLIEMLDAFCKTQGWSKEEMELLGRISLN